MARVKIGTGLTLDYIDLGSRDGTPIVFIHGYIDSWRVWEAALRYFPPEFRLVAVTLRGFGESEKPEQGYEMSDFTKDIDAFMEALDIPEAYIVGQSMGGYVAHQLAVDYPERVRKLVLVGTSPSGATSQSLKDWISDELEGLEDPVPFEMARQAQCEQIVTPVPETRIDAILHESGKAPARAWVGSMLGMLHEDHSDRLSEISVPTLIMYGAGDIFFSSDDQLQLLNAIKDAELKVYSGVGHGVQWEVPQLFAADLTAFLRRDSLRPE